VSVEDDKRSGPPSTSGITENVEKVQEHEDCCQTIHQLTDTTGFSYGSISFEVMLPSACSFIVDDSLSYI
jgi:hypothetical protein